jgi:two-component system sensor histidine kinase DesK
MVTVTASVGTLLVAVDARTWWQAVILSLGVIAALVASLRWTADGFSRVVLPCLIITAVVWIAGVLVVGGHTAFYGLSVAGPLYAPKLPRHRVLAAVGLIAFVAVAGSARLLV